MKRMLTAILIFLMMLLCACGPMGGPSQSNQAGPDYTPTIPHTPTGAVSDVIPHRFTEREKTLYFSAGDSVLCLKEGEMQLLFTADTPDYLFAAGDFLIHREVAERGEDNTPLAYRVVRRALADPERETLLFRGDVQWVHVCRETVWMMTAVPARILGLCDRGRIEAGRRADFTIFRDDFRVEKTVVGGRIAEAAPPSPQG